MRYLSIKNFGRHQHYKDRRPPWIKLHVSVLDDYDFISLSDESKAHLMLLWVLASQTENRIPYDLAWITQRIGARSPVDIEELVLRGFVEPYDEKTARGKREDWSSRYVSAQTRADLLSAAQHICSACGSAEKLEIDHIVPISQGGTGEPSNLQVLCRQCNRRKRAQIAAGGAAQATHLRSKPLRSKTNLRSPETETETETEKRQKLPAAPNRGAGGGASPEPSRPALGAWPKSWAHDTSQRFLAAGVVLGPGVVGAHAKLVRDTLPWDEWLRVVDRMARSGEAGYGLPALLRRLGQFRDGAQPDPNRELTLEELAS